MKHTWFTIGIILLCISNIAESKPQKAPVKSIKSEDGDMIDCMDLYLQPIFNNPLIRNHKKIQMRPGNLPSIGSGNTTRRPAARQTWRKNGSCPHGTIPIRRDKEDFQLATEVAAQPTNNCSLEFAGIQAPVAVSGARGDINVWGIRVETNEWSSSGITISNGHGSFIQFGWMVSPTLYGDEGKTRLFIRTVDPPRGLDCFNLQCEGFAQVSNGIAFGAALAPLSQYGKSQYEIHLSIFKDDDSQDWWAMYGNNPVGYWPAGVLQNFKNGQTTFWGGQVCNTHGELQFTTTGMGSGYHPIEGWQHSAYIHGMEIMESDGTWNRPSRIFPNSSSPACYGVDTYHSEDEGALSAFFGGTANIECCGLACVDYH